TTPFEDPHREAPHARRAAADRPWRVSAVPRGPTAAPRVSQLPLLPRPPGQARRGIGTGFRPPLPVPSSPTAVFRGRRGRLGKLHWDPVTGDWRLQCASPSPLVRGLSV